jgi:hypothetical protein
MDVRKAGLARGTRPLAPGKRDAVNLVLVQLRERAHVPRRRDDDLVMLEDWIEVWDDSNRPARRVRRTAGWTDRKGFGRRPVFPAVAERARGELLLGRQVEVSPHACTRPPRPTRRDDDPLAGNWVLPKLRLQLEAPPPFFFSRKGLIRSIGAGKTIVVVGEPLMSSSVCR